MADHKLALGKELIEGIVHLGNVLGYYVKEEFPVDEPVYGEPPAVDVAWFSQKGNRFPLFIFEVESKATNGMAYNPLKVYAQENRAFEKPLFFFHVIAQGGVYSSRPKNLEALHGKNNYRIYFVGSDSANDLIKDILNQHSRVRNDVNYLRLHQLLISELWRNKVDYSNLLMHSVDLELSKNEIISSYIKMCISDSNLHEDFIKIITNDSNSKFSNVKLSSYNGAHWYLPILCSMLCGLSEDKQQLSHLSSMVLEWQLDEFRFYDDLERFYPNTPELIFLCIVLSNNKGTFQFQLLKRLEQNIDKIDICHEGVSTAVYLLHISAAFMLRKQFTKASIYLKKFKILSESDSYIPPLKHSESSILSKMQIEFDDYFHLGADSMDPTMESFISSCTELYKNSYHELIPLALKVLDYDLGVYEGATDLIEILWSNIANKHFKRN